MALADNLQSLGEKLIRDCEERQKTVATIKTYVHELLSEISDSRVQMSRDLRESLQEDRSNRLNELSRLLDEYTKDRMEARKYWEEALESLKKIREKC
jgi:predicted  nucleic acid-binding Zn-ribbon protein